MSEAPIGATRSTLDTDMQRDEPPHRSRTWGLKLPDWGFESCAMNLPTTNRPRSSGCWRTSRHWKGQEWTAVFILNVVDGCIPSDMSTGSPDEIDEERRLLYVAMTRAKRHLHLIYPIRFYRSQQQRLGDAHVFAPLSRFIPDCVLDQFERRQWPESVVGELAPVAQAHRVDVAARMRICGDGSTNAEIQKIWANCENLKILAQYGL
jgi:UvrD-like helicase family protein